MKSMLATIDSTNRLSRFHSILTDRTWLCGTTHSKSRSSVHLLICRDHRDICEILIKSHCKQIRKHRGVNKIILIATGYETVSPVIGHRATTNRGRSLGCFTCSCSPYSHRRFRQIGGCQRHLLGHIGRRKGYSLRFR